MQKDNLHAQKNYPAYPPAYRPPTHPPTRTYTTLGFRICSCASSIRLQVIFFFLRLCLFLLDSFPLNTLKKKKISANDGTELFSPRERPQTRTEPLRWYVPFLHHHIPPYHPPPPHPLASGRQRSAFCTRWINDAYRVLQRATAGLSLLPAVCQKMLGCLQSLWYHFLSATSSFSLSLFFCFLFPCFPSSLSSVFCFLTPFVPPSLQSPLIPPPRSCNPLSRSMCIFFSYPLSFVSFSASTVFSFSHSWSVIISSPSSRKWTIRW